MNSSKYIRTMIRKWVSYIYEEFLCFIIRADFIQLIPYYYNYIIKKLSKFFDHFQLILNTNLEQLSDIHTLIKHAIFFKTKDIWSKRVYKILYFLPNYKKYFELICWSWPEMYVLTLFAGWSWRKAWLRSWFRWLWGTD